MIWDFGCSRLGGSQHAIHLKRTYPTRKGRSMSSTTSTLAAIKLRGVAAPSRVVIPQCGLSPLAEEHGVWMEQTGAEDSLRVHGT
eukprot:1925706-Amphidinium_carterae.1